MAAKPRPRSPPRQRKIAPSPRAVVATSVHASRAAELSAHVREGRTDFALFTTTAEKAALRLYDDEARTTRRGGGARVRGDYEMRPLGNGHFAIATGDAPHGTRYAFVLDGERVLPDPFARFLPEGVHGPAIVWAPQHAWTHPAPAPRALADHVTYELHVGAFTREGTYRAALAKLTHVAALGATAIELLPVAAFAGRRGWGYDGVSWFAPFAPYGTPDDLRALVDHAHGLGLAVFLDVVYNHFGPDGAYVGAYAPELVGDAPTRWGDAPNFSHPLMRALVVENACYWLRDFRFDGLRLDATHAIVDPSPTHIVREIANAAHAIGAARVRTRSRAARARLEKLVIAEHDTSAPNVIATLGADGAWDDDFHRQLHVTLTGARDGHFAAYTPGAAGLARIINRGARRGPLVYAFQNHDHIGNRARGDRAAHHLPVAAYRAAAALLFFLPQSPLLFMGQEWGASTPFPFFTDHHGELGALVREGRRAEFKGYEGFDESHGKRTLGRMGGAITIPDPQADATFASAKLAWSERTRAPHAAILELHVKLIALRRTDPVLSDSSAKLTARADGDRLIATRANAAGTRTIIVNVGKTPSAALFGESGALVFRA